MNKVLIVDASESDRRLMSGLLVKSGYEPIAVEAMEAVKDEVAKLPPGAVNVVQRLGVDKQLPEVIRRYIRSVPSSMQDEVELISRPSGEFDKIRKKIDCISPANANVVIIGESDMGEEQMAKTIYLQSSRTDKPLVFSILEISILHFL